MRKFLMATTLCLTACSLEKGCEMETKLVDLAATNITKQLACKNGEAVKEDVQKAISKLGLCQKEAAAAGGIPEVACPLVAKAIAELVATQIPAKWECSGGNAKDGLEKAILAACIAGTAAQPQQ